MKKTLKTLCQIIDEYPTVAVQASTGKTAINVNALCILRFD